MVFGPRRTSKLKMGLNIIKASHMGVLQKATMLPYMPLLSGYGYCYYVVFLTMATFHDFHLLIASGIVRGGKFDHLLLLIMDKQFICYFSFSFTEISYTSKFEKWT